MKTIRVPLAAFRISPRDFKTGAFGIPGRSAGKTHVTRDGKPLCGLKPHPRAVFQFQAAGIFPLYIECRRCMERAVPLQREIERLLPVRRPRTLAETRTP